MMKSMIHKQSMLIIMLTCLTLFVFAQANQETAKDGQHDFDFEIGRWTTHLKVLLNPLTGSNTWAEFEGVSEVKKIMNGRANLVELTAKGPTGIIEGINLRLYNPESKQWSLSFSNMKRGTLAHPVFGQFHNGIGEFYGQENLRGKMILVRFIISPITPDQYRFEQAFSEDGGKTWEVNWIATDIRLKE